MTAEIQAIGVVKRYGPLLANDHVDLSVERGETHAVMGENGAGKSTLMSILYGMQSPDEGKILLRGREVRYRSALDAIAEGMGMVHQAFKLFNSLTVWENVVYGREPKRVGFLDRDAAVASVRALAGRYRLQVDPLAVVGKLSVGVRQRVEILKALYRDAENPHSRRTDGGADAPGARRAFRGHPQSHGGRAHGDFRHSQAARGHDDHGPRHRAARRQGHRPHGHEGNDGARDHPGDDRARRQSHDREGRGEPRRARAESSRGSR